MVSRVQVVAAAREWADYRWSLNGKDYVGVRWRHEGRNKHGVDCCGLVICIAWQLGLSTYDIRGYGREPQAGFVRHFIEAGCIPIPRDEACAGDIGLFRSDKWPFHSGILAERADGVRTLIHSHLPNKRVIEQPFSELIVDNWTHALRFPGVEV